MILIYSSEQKQGWAICKENTRRLGLYEAVTFRCWSLSPGFSQYKHVILGLWFALYLPVVSIREKERELLLCFFIYIFSHKCKWRTCALEVVSGFFYSNIFVLLLFLYFLHKLYCGGGRTCAVEVVTVDFFLLFNSYVFLLLLLLRFCFYIFCSAQVVLWSWWPLIFLFFNSYKNVFLLLRFCFYIFCAVEALVLWRWWRLVRRPPRHSHTDSVPQIQFLLILTLFTHQVYSYNLFPSSLAALNCARILLFKLLEDF